MVDQVTVFLENTKGRLGALVHAIAAAGVNMSALTIADTADYGLVRIICNEPKRTVAALLDSDFRAKITRVSAIEVPNRPGGLVELFDVLAREGLNIEYGYCFSINDEKAIDVLKIGGVDAAEKAEAILTAAGFKPLTQKDVAL